MSFRRNTLAPLFGALLVLYVILEYLVKAGTLAALVAIVLVVIGAVLLFRLIRHSLGRAIWRLRNRLIVTYVFIGVVPVALILTLAVLGTWIIVGQVAVYMVNSELDRRASSLVDPVRILSQAKAADRPVIVQQMGSFLASRMPGFQMFVAGDQDLRYPSGSSIQTHAADWKDYTGYIAKNGVYYSAAVARNNGTTVIGLAPITRDVLEKIVPGIGSLNLVTEREGSIGLNGRAGAIPPAWFGLKWLDLPALGVNPIPYVELDHPDTTGTAYLSVATRPSAALGAVFSKGLELGQAWLLLFVGVACTLLLVELVSFVIGLSLTRTITGAVHKLYEGTSQISKGNFAWRIPVKGSDQLAELGRSFNNMSAQIENLVVIAREKERLQSEIKIASEVQNLLFPRSAPVMRTIELVGICEPASMASGDYYDYLCLPDGNLALAIGDVAGKGISAALLMASIQSIVRTQLAAGMPLSTAVGNGHSTSRFSTSSIVAQLNRQLYANTSPEKYATFFFGAYDEHSRVLTYTNAGHLPPLLLRRGEVKLLEVTGTVIGAFPSIRYEEQTVNIDSGDLLIAYTDGITEPENAYGVEFGADRLAETALRHQDCEAKEIVAKIMEAVRQWSASPELPDDMTVLIARGLVQ